MKKILKINILIIFVMMSFILVGCKNETASLYLFSKEGGSVLINDETVSSYKRFDLKKGSTVSLSAKPNENYGFNYWLVNDFNFSTEQNITLTLDADYVVKAVFTQGDFYIYIRDNETNEILNSIPIKGGEKISLPIPEAREGYTAKYMYGDKEISSGEIFNYTHSIDIKLVYTLNTFTINLPTSANYVVEPLENYSTTVNANSSFKFKVRILKDVEEDRISVYANNVKLTPVNNIYTIENINENINITIQFENALSVSLVSDYCDLQGDTFVFPNESYSFKLLAKENYILDNCVVKVNNKIIIPVNSTYTINNVIENLTIQVSNIGYKVHCTLNFGSNNFKSTYTPPTECDIIIENIDAVSIDQTTKVYINNKQYTMLNFIKELNLNSNEKLIYQISQGTQKICTITYLESEIQSIKFIQFTKDSIKNLNTLTFKFMDAD